MRASFRSRIHLLYLLIFLFAGVATIRLFFLQVLRGDTYRELADHQYAQPTGVVYDRGTIYFKEKNGSLISAASLKTTYELILNPSQIANPIDLYVKLAPYLVSTGAEFLERASRPNDVYEVVAKGLTKASADAISELGLDGVSLYKEHTRVYPAGSLAAHVLGFTGLSSDGGPYPIGRYGIEKFFNTLLTRTSSDLSINFFAELFGNIQDTLKGNIEPEGDVVLTIEPTVQDYLEKQVAAAKEKWSADSAGGIIIEPSTGRIIAMAGLPNFDPNNFSKEDDVGVFTNPLVEKVYEMGSIVKPLTMAAAIDAGAVTPETTYNDQGTLTLNGKKISNFDGKARGVISMQEVLNQSLNVGAVFAEQKLGAEAFRTYFKAYGLGEKTGVELPGEVGGLVKNLDSPREVELATASFGQGIAVTPIEITRALSTLANGGVLMEPHIVDRIIYKAGIEKTIAPVEQGRILKKETAKTLSTMLTKVVDEHLANGKAKMEHYSIAAKTGTAQMADPNGGGYYADRYLHSFFGYFPKDNARYLTFLYIVYPKGVRYSSETLTEPFMNIAKYLIQYFEIPPDR